jgi:hypothetical protein
MSRRQRGNQMRANARGNASVYQAGGDQHLHGQHHHRYEVEVSPDNGSRALFEGRGPGRLLLVVGLLVTVVSFAGWMSIVFHGGSSDPQAAQGFGDMLGRRLPSGIRVGVVYFLGFGAGGLVLAVGAAMARTGARKGVTAGHWIVTVILLGALVAGLFGVLGGASPSALLPNLKS